METTRTKTPAETPLAQWLDAALKERGWGVRTLARKMNPTEPEVARRALNRYLYAGSNPSEANRELIAAAFEIDAAEVPAEPGPFLGETAAQHG